MNSWSAERLFFENDELFESIVADIDAAKTSIEVETYIYTMDKLGERIADRLEAADRRGVRVHLSVDAAGSSADAKKIRARYAKTGVTLFRFHRLFDLGFFGFLSRYNRRNHRKTWIFDSRIAYVGSVNITIPHLPKKDGGQDWKDANLRVEGPQVELLSAAFAHALRRHPAWHRFLGKIRRQRERASRPDDLVELNDSPQKRRALRHAMLARFRNARRRIWLANAYFAPDRKLLRELCAARLRGVDVRLLVPNRSDVFFMPWLTATYYEDLLKAGIAIYEYLPSVLHAKIRIVDDRMVVGSSNLDYRSLLYNLESDVQVTHPENKRATEAELQKCFEASEQVTLEAFHKTHLFQRLLGRFFSPLIKWI